MSVQTSRAICRGLGPPRALAPLRRLALSPRPAQPFRVLLQLQIQLAEPGQDQRRLYHHLRMMLARRPLPWPLSSLTGPAHWTCSFAAARRSGRPHEVVPGHLQMKRETICLRSALPLPPCQKKKKQNVKNRDALCVVVDELGWQLNQAVAQAICSVHKRHSRRQILCGHAGRWDCSAQRRSRASIKCR